MGKTTKIHDCDSQPVPEKSGWSALATITTFDRGKSTSQRWRKETAMIPKRVTTFTPSSLFVESLVEQLCKLFEKDPVSQKKLYGLICQKLYEMKLIDKTYKVEEFQFMRSHYQRALYHLLTVSNSPAIDCKLETFLNQSPSSLSLPPPINSSVFDWSRYQNEFEEIEFIARGGFGRVFRVRNKVDGCEYAIKKICLRFYGDDQFRRSLGEVRTLAKLDHCNIVAYKAAWFEPFTGLVTGEGCSSSSSSKISPDVELSDEGPESSVSDVPRRESPTEVEDDSGGIIFANGNENASKEVLDANASSIQIKEDSLYVLESNCEHRQWPQVAPHDSTMSLPGLPEHYESLCSHSSDSDKKGCRGRKVPGTRHRIECAVLHIQMQLCKESLRKWLDVRNETLLEQRQHGGEGAVAHLGEDDPGGVGVVTALRIFQGILNGVEYMHSMGVVHHDLKPSNIFVEGFEYAPLWDTGARGNQNASGGSNVKVPARGPLLPGKEHGKSQVRVGDFGLACHIAQPPTTLIDDPNVSSDDMDGAGTVAMAIIPMDTSRGITGCLLQTRSAMRGGDKKAKEIVGTRLYAAPEQLEGQCSQMSDTYSLAIILFELLHPFFTAMERGKVISALRASGKLPQEFEHSFPELASLIKNMLSQNPSHRPPIERIIEVLQSLLPAHSNNVLNVRQDSVCSDDSDSVNECIVRNRSRTSSFTQTYEESYADVTQYWEERVCEENQVGSSHCGNFTCHAMRERQDKTISKLWEENLKKDVLIDELKKRILQLEMSSKTLGQVKENASHKYD